MMVTPVEVMESVVKTLGEIQGFQRTQLDTARKMLDRLHANEDRTIKLMHQVLYLKTALCLTWIAAATFAVWLSSQPPPP